MKDFLQQAVFGTLGALMLLLSGSAVAFAQTSEGLQVKPAVVDGQVNPSETHGYTVTVTNVSNATRTLYVSVQDIKAVDSEGRPVFANTGEVTGFELSSWVGLEEKTITLGAGQSKGISFTVRIPGNASPGSHFASLFFTDKPTAPGNSGSGVGMTIGAIISLRISGDIHEEAQLREFSTDKLVYGTPDVVFNSRVQNLGNVLVQPRGTVEVSNMFGKKVATIPVNDALASVFPNSNRTYSVEWKSEDFSFGRYQAIVTLVYGDEARRTIYSTTSFWVLPLVPIATVLGVLLAIVLGAYALMRAYIRRALRQMGVPNAGRAETDAYRKKYQKSGPRLMVVTMAVLLLCIVFLAILFLLFA